MIELLVVIAIIAILASILFPVFARAREKARGSQCLSNLKQIGLAFNMYVQDWDETYPPSSGPGPNPDWNLGNLSYWYNFTLPYTSKQKDTAIFYCPSARITHKEYAYPIYYNYGYNNSVFAKAGKTMSDFPKLADMYMVMDYSNASINNAYASFSGSLKPCTQFYIPGAGGVDDAVRAAAEARTNLQLPANAKLWNDFMKGRHDGVINVVFGDGHAEGVRTEIVTDQFYYKNSTGAFSANPK